MTKLKKRQQKNMNIMKNNSLEHDYNHGYFSQIEKDLDAFKLLIRKQSPN